MIQTIPITNFADYELIDCGNFYKLERFGKIILSRPEPQAIWDKSLSEEAWMQKAHAHFVRKKEGVKTNKEDAGEWQILKNFQPVWNLAYQYKNLQLQCKLRLTSFKHVGIFPEQADNWKFIYDSLSEKPNAKFLNLFAYSGMASLAAKATNADTTHVDSVKSVITWARENMELSSLSNVRWVVEDALKFVKNEVKRGKKYDGIILDPPAYGRGPDGEKWILEEQLNELLKSCSSLLNEKGFLILNLYSIGFSAIIAETILAQHFKGAKISVGELYVADSFGKKLPFGLYGRVTY